MNEEFRRAWDRGFLAGVIAVFAGLLIYLGLRPKPEPDHAQEVSPPPEPEPQSTKEPALQRQIGFLANQATPPSEAEKVTRK